MNEQVKSELEQAASKAYIAHEDIARALLSLKYMALVGAQKAALKRACDALDRLELQLDALTKTREV